MCVTARCAFAERGLIVSEGFQDRWFSKWVIQISMRCKVSRHESQSRDIGMSITLGDIVRKVVNMETQAIKADKSPLLSIEMILICVAGIAVAMGWIPT